MSSNPPPLYLQRYRIALFTWSAFMMSMFVYVALYEVIRSPDESVPQLLRAACFIVALCSIPAVPLIRALVARSPLQGGTAVDRLLTLSIVGWAVAEVPAFLGILLGFEGAGRLDVYVLVLIATANLAWHVPRRDRWKQAAIQDAQGEG